MNMVGVGMDFPIISKISRIKNQQVLINILRNSFLTHYACMQASAITDQ